MTNGFLKIAVLVILPCLAWAGIGYASYGPAKKVLKEARLTAGEIRGDARSAAHGVKGHVKVVYRGVRVLKREAQQLLRT